MCTPVLNTVLQCTPPDYWDEAEYHNIVLKRFSLPTNSHEYIKIRNEFVGEFGTLYRITEISRIQHPYAYAYCQMRRKELGVMFRYIPAERRIFFCVDNADQVTEFLECNCDERKAFCRGLNGSLAAAGCVVMAKEIIGQSIRMRSSHGYPDYLINYKIPLGMNNLNNSFAGLMLH